MFKVYSRHGWGWVIRDDYQPASYPIETAIAAQAYADALNSNLDNAQALKKAGLVFDGYRMTVA